MTWHCRLFLSPSHFFPSKKRQIKTSSTNYEDWTLWCARPNLLAVINALKFDNNHSVSPLLWLTGTKWRKFFNTIKITLRPLWFINGAWPKLYASIIIYRICSLLMGLFQYMYVRVSQGGSDDFVYKVIKEQPAE